MPKKGPGTSQLGHAPFSKVKLEGPKVHHDYHGMNASVPGKGSGPAVGQNHWERHYTMNEVRDTDKIAGTEWNAKKSDSRTVTYNKVNDCDH